MTLNTFLKSVYVPLRLRGRSPESVRLLSHAIRQFSLFLGHEATVADFDDLVVSQFLLHRAQTLAPDSVARERSGLVALWNVANARGLVALRPCVAPELTPEKTPRALTEEELRRLYVSATMEKGWIGPIEAKVFFPALIVVDFETSERIGALLKCPREGWQRPTLIVPAHVRKGKRKYRDYVLSEEASDMLDAVSRHQFPTLFHWPYSFTAIYKRWHNITRRAGLGEGRDVQFHVLRRSTASHLDVAGGDAQKQLGHSSRRLTQKYLDPRITGRKQVAPWQLLPRIVPDEPQPPEAPAA